MAITEQALRKRRNVPLRVGLVVGQAFRDNKVFCGVDQWLPKPSCPERTKQEGRFGSLYNGGGWRLQCYTIKSHCAGLFLALGEGMACVFMCNFLRKLIRLKVVSRYRRIH